MRGEISASRSSRIVRNEFFTARRSKVRYSSARSDTASRYFIAPYLGRMCMTCLPSRAAGQREKAKRTALDAVSGYGPLSAATEGSDATSWSKSAHCGHSGRTDCGDAPSHLPTFTS